MEAILKIKAVVETAIYVDDLRAAETFYGTVLGLRVMGKEPGRHVFFQVGEASVLPLSWPKPPSRATSCLRTRPPGLAISPWGSRQKPSTPGGSSCKTTASPSRRKLSGRGAASPFTFVILPGIRWNW